jgi:GT2 family glycosyltransferase
LNPDTELVTNAIYGMKKFLDAHLDYGAVGCRLVYADGRIQFVCARAFPTPFRQFCYLSLLEKIFPKAALFSSIEMRYWDHQNNSDIDCLSGACILARKEIVDELKGFDENLFMYAEDVDLCYRIKEAGWKIYYLYEDVILHYGGSSSKKTDRKYFSTLLQRESNYYFHQKHYGENRAKEYLFAVLIGSLFRIFVVLGATPVILCSERVRQKIPPDAIIKYSLLSKWALKTLLVGIERKSKSPAQA